MPDMPFHHMKVRLTITRDLMITAAEAVTIAGPYALCPIANDVFANLLEFRLAPAGDERLARQLVVNKAHPYHRVDGAGRNYRLPDPIW